MLANGCAEIHNPWDQKYSFVAFSDLYVGVILNIDKIREHFTL